MVLLGPLAGLLPQPRVCPSCSVAMGDQPFVDRLMSNKKLESIPNHNRRCPLPATAGATLYYGTWEAKWVALDVRKRRQEAWEEALLLWQRNRFSWGKAQCIPHRVRASSLGSEGCTSVKSQFLCTLSLSGSRHHTLHRSTLSSCSVCQGCSQGCSSLLESISLVLTSNLNSPPGGCCKLFGELSSICLHNISKSSEIITSVLNYL